MTNLSEITTKDLEEELKRRREEKPKMKEDIDFEPLKKECQDYIDNIQEYSGREMDVEHTIFEIALEAIFGNEVFDFVNLILD